MAKQKPQLVSINGTGALNDVMREMKEITIRVNRAQAKADEKVKRATEELTAATEADVERQKLLEQSLEAYAEKNRASLFADARTYTTPHGDFGFRTNPASVELLLKKTDDVVAAIKKKGKKFLDFIKKGKEGIDKNFIKAQYDAQLVTDKELTAMGLVISQGETFFINLTAADAGDVAA